MPRAISWVTAIQFSKKSGCPIIKPVFKIVEAGQNRRLSQHSPSPFFSLLDLDQVHLITQIRNAILSNQPFMWRCFIVASPSCMNCLFKASLRPKGYCNGEELVHYFLIRVMQHGLGKANNTLGQTHAIKVLIFSNFRL